MMPSTSGVTSVSQTVGTVIPTTNGQNNISVEEVANQLHTLLCEADLNIKSPPESKLNIIMSTKGDGFRQSVKSFIENENLNYKELAGFVALIYVSVYNQTGNPENTCKFINDVFSTNIKEVNLNIQNNYETMNIFLELEGISPGGYAYIRGVHRKALSELGISLPDDSDIVNPATFETRLSNYSYFDSHKFRTLSSSGMEVTVAKVLDYMNVPYIIYRCYAETEYLMLAKVFFGEFYDGIVRHSTPLVIEIDILNSEKVKCLLNSALSEDPNIGVVRFNLTDKLKTLTAKELVHTYISVLSGLCKENYRSYPKTLKIVYNSHNNHLNDKIKTFTSDISKINNRLDSVYPLTTISESSSTRLLPHSNKKKENTGYSGISKQYTITFKNIPEDVQFFWHSLNL